MLNGNNTHFNIAIILENYHRIKDDYLSYISVVVVVVSMPFS